MWRAQVRHIFIQAAAVGENKAAADWSRDRGTRHQAHSSGQRQRWTAGRL